MKIEIAFFTPTDKIKKSLDTASFTVGRGSAADLIFSNQELSRVHFRIDVEGEGVYITDLGSSNGTFLNQNKIHASTKVLVQEGDKISFGNHKSYYFKFKLLEVDSLIQSARGVANEIPSNVPKAPVDIELENESPFAETSFGEMSKKSEVNSHVFDISSENKPVTSGTKFDISSPSPAKEAYESEKRLHRQKAVALKLVVEQLQEHADQAKIELDMLGSKKIKFLAEIENFKEKKEKLESEYEKLIEKNEFLITKNEEIKSEILLNKDSFEEQIKAEKAKIEAAVSLEYKNIREEFENLKVEYEDTYNQVEKLKQEKSVLELNLEKLRGEFSNMQNQSKKLTEDITKISQNKPKIPIDNTIANNFTSITEIKSHEVDDKTMAVDENANLPAIPLTVAGNNDVKTDLDFIQKRYYKTLSDLALIEESIDEKLMLLDLLEGELGIPEKDRKVS